jgi:hypothetical protein
VWSRGRWLLGLLVLQSTSSFVLDSYQGLLKEHLVVTLFLTMLVGAGGNAGKCPRQREPGSSLALQKYIIFLFLQRQQYPLLLFSMRFVGVPLCDGCMCCKQGKRLQPGKLC